jgi:hypothetical protein
MPRAWARLIVALICIATVLLATVLADPGSNHPPITAVLPLLGLLFGAVTVVLVRRGAPPCTEQPASLLSLVLFRAPPAA